MRLRSVLSWSLGCCLLFILASCSKDSANSLGSLDQGQPSFKSTSRVSVIWNNFGCSGGASRATDYNFYDNPSTIWGPFASVNPDTVGSGVFDWQNRFVFKTSTDGSLLANVTVDGSSVNPRIHVGAPGSAAYGTPCVGGFGWAGAASEGFDVYWLAWEPATPDSGAGNYLHMAEYDQRTRSFTLIRTINLGGSRVENQFQSPVYIDGLQVRTAPGITTYGWYVVCAISGGPGLPGTLFAVEPDLLNMWTHTTTGEILSSPTTNQMNDKVLLIERVNSTNYAHVAVYNEITLPQVDYSTQFGWTNLFTIASRPDNVVPGDLTGGDDGYFFVATPYELLRLDTSGNAYQIDSWGGGVVGTSPNTSPTGPPAIFDARPTENTPDDRRKLVLNLYNRNSTPHTYVKVYRAFPDLDETPPASSLLWQWTSLGLGVVDSTSPAGSPEVSYSLLNGQENRTSHSAIHVALNWGLSNGNDSSLLYFKRGTNGNTWNDGSYWAAPIYTRYSNSPVAISASPTAVPQSFVNTPEWVFMPLKTRCFAVYGTP
jgi:hypothetical protein